MPQAAQASVDALKLSLLLPPASSSRYSFCHRTMYAGISFRLAALHSSPFLALSLSLSPPSPVATRRRVRRSNRRPDNSMPRSSRLRWSLAIWPRVGGGVNGRTKWCGDGDTGSQPGTSTD
ncbi:hypothetical protein C8F01DRAFT_1369278 [Mycena amicta]|nr:hypothetical protein C8F01DRAFT_1369278 [Mycena amicta]